MQIVQLAKIKAIIHFWPTRQPPILVTQRKSLEIRALLQNEEPCRAKTLQDPKFYNLMKLKPQKEGDF